MTPPRAVASFQLTRAGRSKGYDLETTVPSTTTGAG